MPCRPPTGRPRPCRPPMRGTAPTPTRTRNAEETDMFTGIVEELGTVAAIEHGRESAVLRIDGPLVVSDAAHGASIAVNGVCLTVTEHDATSFTVDVMAETLDRSSL